MALTDRHREEWINIFVISGGAIALGFLLGALAGLISPDGWTWWRLGSLMALIFGSVVLFVSVFAWLED